MHSQSVLRRFTGIALTVLVMMLTIQTAGCSEVNISGKTAADVFADPQTLGLVEAACRGDLAKVDALNRQGANVNATGYRGMTPLFWTMACKNYAGIEKLLELGADPNYKMEGDISAMYASSGSDDPHFLPLMLAHGGNPNIRAGYRTALMIAIEQNRTSNIQLLLDHGANVNEHDEGGSTAATQAAGLAKLGVVAMLLEHGYNYDLQGLALEVNGRLVSPSLAAEKQHVLDMLKNRGVKFPLPPPHIGPPPPGITSH